ncbi:DUF2795 domain-containing protein [Streptosporangium sp. NPDC049644]|uniref:DUF2795 domain-containing protein n=1 Tax=Streptosporangium sp. NPDC049644 TaxID=3155507 RepID=UPI003413B99B
MEPRDGLRPGRPDHPRLTWPTASCDSSPTEVGKAFGEVARHHPERVSYPARREHLVTEARARGTHRVVVDSLLMIPEWEYLGVDAVLVELIESE